MNNIKTNIEKTSLKLANNLYEMGIYREPDLTSIVQFDNDQNQFRKINNEVYIKYIIHNSPSLAIDLKDDVLKHIPVLPDYSNNYNIYTRLNNAVNFKYITKLENIINSKYELDKSYRKLDKPEKRILEELAKEEIYYCIPIFSGIARNRNSCEQNCFMKHDKNHHFQAISLFELYGRERIREFKFQKWGNYLPNIDKVLLDNVTRLDKFNEYKRDNIDLITYVNEEMGI